jgi:hypothetical protein
MLGFHAIYCQHINGLADPSSNEEMQAVTILHHHTATTLHVLSCIVYLSRRASQLQDHDNNPRSAEKYVVKEKKTRLSGISGARAHAHAKRSF